MIIGIVMIIIGTKTPTLFKGLYESVKDEEQIKKLGTAFKIGRYILILITIIHSVRIL